MYASLLSLVILSLTLCAEGQDGVFLSLNGKNISNGSFVDMNAIGDIPDASGALICHTDIFDCCTASLSPDNTEIGQWQFPDGRNVQNINQNRNSRLPSVFHRDRGRSIVRLWRRGNPTESGLFCCVVPNSRNETITLCANIVNIMITSQPVYQRVVREDTATLSVGAVIASQDSQDTSVIEYQWQRNNVSLEDGSKFEGTRTSQLSVSNFQGSDEGIYRCVLNNVVITDEVVLTLGVYLYFDGDPISNNSYINLDEQSNFRIDCNTNKSGCCRSSDDGGNWYFPSEGLVSTRGKSVPPTFILNRRSSTISLSVYGLGVMERGRFHCRVPNSNDVKEDVYVYLLSKPSFLQQPASLTTVYSSRNTTLSVEGFGGDLTYHWMKDGAMVSDSDKYHGTGTSTLTVTDAHKEDEGVYTCTISNVLGSATSLSSLMSVVNEPEVGESYSLTCSVASSGAVHPSLSYQWYKDGEELTNQTSPTLFFDSLTFCDTGHYSCGAVQSDSVVPDDQQFELFFPSVQFQLQLSGDEKCSPETVRLGDVTNSFIQALNDACQCNLTATHISEEQLACDTEVEDRVLFSARLHKTELASTYDLINHVNNLVNDSTILNIQRESDGTGASMQLVVEELLSPLCLADGNEGATVEPAAGRSLSAAEVAMWIFLTFLIITVAVALILSGVVMIMRRRLKRMKHHSSTTKRPGRPESMHIATDSNVCYQHVQSDSSLPIPDRNTTNSEVYEEIVVTNDEHYVYSAPYL